MKLSEAISSTFNHPETVVMVSSFPDPNDEIAKDNAVARYTSLLVNQFPKSRKIVVISEKRTDGQQSAYLASDNILIIPTYTVNSPKLYKQVLNTLALLPAVHHVLVQFELSVFGNKAITFGLPLLLSALKLQRKHVSIMLHQVITDINEMAGHIGLQKGSTQSGLTNLALRNFYRLVGKTTHQVIVHDEVLKTKLAGYVNEEKITVIPHGIKVEVELTETDKIIARQKYGLSQNDKVVLAYGYLSWYKGSDWIVKAMGELAKTYPTQSFKLMLAGDSSPTQKDNPAYQKFSKQLENTLNEYKTSVIATGFVPEQEVKNVFAAADIVVFPYRARMSASGALSLAWQYHKPFLLSTHCGENLLTDDAQLALNKNKISADSLSFDLNNQSEFTNKLVALFNNPDLASKASAIGEHLTTQRSWPVVALRYDHVITGKTELSNLKSKNKLNSLSVFFPMHNEEANVGRVIEQAQQVLPTVADKYEIIIVNDGSQDATSALAHLYAMQDKHIKVIDQKNLGYGGALQAGFKAAKYDWVFFSDGDLQFDLNEIRLVITETKENKVVIGYRKHRADSLKRLFLAQLLKVWNRFFFQFPTEIKDIDCAFKLFHSSVVKHIFPLQSQGAMISTELILRLLDAEYKIAQVGVTHYPRQFGQQTGANFHVIKGAVIETWRLLQERQLRGLANFARLAFSTSLATAIAVFLYTGTKR